MPRKSSTPSLTSSSVSTPSAASTQSVSRRRRQAVVQQYDDDDDDGDDDGDGDAPAANPPPAPTNPMNLNVPKRTKANTSSRREPTAPLSRAAKSRSKTRNMRLSDNSGEGGSSIPSYDDTLTTTTTRRSAQHSPSYFPPMPPTDPPSNSYFSRPHGQPTAIVPSNLDRSINTDYSSSTSTPSSSSSSNGPWQPLPTNHTSVALKRNKTVRNPISAPVQAIVPRAPRNVAVARLLEESDDEEAVPRAGLDRGGGELPPPPPPMKKLVAGGKKAALAVELKLNLEIELELKAYIHGDVTLELFN